MFEQFPVDRLKESCAVQSLHHIDPPVTLLQQRSRGALVVLAPTQGQQLAIMISGPCRAAKLSPGQEYGIGQIDGQQIGFHLNQPVRVADCLNLDIGGQVCNEASRQIGRIQALQVVGNHLKVVGEQKACHVLILLSPP